MFKIALILITDTGIIRFANRIIVPQNATPLKVIAGTFFNVFCQLNEKFSQKLIENIRKTEIRLYQKSINSISLFIKSVANNTYRITSIKIIILNKEKRKILVVEPTTISPALVVKKVKLCRTVCILIKKYALFMDSKLDNF